MEIYILCKWETKESGSSNPHIRQKRPMTSQSSLEKEEWSWRNQPS